jgi:hypothetical protein
LNKKARDAILLVLIAALGVFELSAMEISSRGKAPWMISFKGSKIRVLATQSSQLSNKQTRELQTRVLIYLSLNPLPKPNPS